MTKRRMWMYLAAGVAIALPAIAWATFKPVRILAPMLNGVTCVDRACVEESDRMAEARTLQQAAVSAVGRKLAPLEEAPLTVFCSSRECYRSFGGGKERGATLLDWGVILPPESWVAHKEGMPFLVSSPPDYDLPGYARPLALRHAAWEKRTGRNKVWRAAEDL